MFTVKYRNAQGKWVEMKKRFQTYAEAETSAYAAAPDGAYLVEAVK